MRVASANNDTDGQIWPMLPEAGRKDCPAESAAQCAERCSDEENELE